MKRLKTVGIKELKNNLSAYLREVRNGATVLVSDRNTIVAELHEPYRRTALGEVVDPSSWSGLRPAWYPSHARDRTLEALAGEIAGRNLG